MYNIHTGALAMKQTQKEKEQEIQRKILMLNAQLQRLTSLDIVLRDTADLEKEIIAITGLYNEIIEYTRKEHKAFTGRLTL